MATDSAQLESPEPSTAAEPTKPLPGPKKEIDLKKVGKYELQKKIGAGGMGAVYLALDAGLKRSVALKLLPHEKAQNPTLVRRFHAEAQSAAALRHDNIVTVYEAGEADGYNFIALEYVDGIDADNLVRKRGIVPIKRSIEIVKQVAQALAHAQSQGIVHRDIKPANLLIRRDGVVKLADLGLARSLDEQADMGITRAGTTVGTVDYMSPEQARDSKAADVRSDLYSLGCTWYHLLTGQPPYPGGNMSNKLREHAMTPLPDARQKNPAVPEAVVAILRRLTAKDPKQRYQTPGDLIRDLDNADITRSEVSQDILSQLARAEATLTGQDVPPDAAKSTGGSSAEFLAVITGAAELPDDSGESESPSSAQTRDIPASKPAIAPVETPQKKKTAPAPAVVKKTKKKLESETAVPHRDTTRLVIGGVATLAVVAVLGILWSVMGSHASNEVGLSEIDPSARAGQTPEIVAADPAQAAKQKQNAETPATPKPKVEPEKPLVVRDDAGKTPDTASANNTPSSPSVPVTPPTPDKSAPAAATSLAVIRALPPRELLEPETSQRTVRIDLTKISDLGKQLADQKLTTGTLVVVSGFGTKPSSPIIIRDAWIRIRFDQTDGPPLVITPRLGEYDRASSKGRDDAFITVSRGGIEFINGTFSIPVAERIALPNWLLQVTDGDFVLRNCRLLGPLSGTHRNKGLIQWLHGGQHLTARPFVGNHEAYGLVIDSFLAGSGTLIDAEPRRRAMFWRNSIGAARDDLFTLRLTGPDSSISATVDLERSTLSAAGTIFKVEAAELGAPTTSPLTVVADRCVFAPPLRLTAQKPTPTLLAYAGKLLDQNQFAWWETHCGYANDIACFLRPASEAPSPQPFETTWTAHWGANHIEKPLLGLGVILKNELRTDRTKLDATSFDLLEKSQAAAWAPDGGPIGAVQTASGDATKKPTTAPPSKPKSAGGF